MGHSLTIITDELTDCCDISFSSRSLGSGCIGGRGFGSSLGFLLGSLVSHVLGVLLSFNLLSDGLGLLSLLNFLGLFSVVVMLVGLLDLLADDLVVSQEFVLVDDAILVLVTSLLNLGDFGGSNGLLDLLLGVEGSPDPFGEGVKLSFLEVTRAVSV